MGEFEGDIIDISDQVPQEPGVKERQKALAQAEQFATQLDRKQLEAFIGVVNAIVPEAIKIEQIDSIREGVVAVPPFTGEQLVDPEGQPVIMDNPYIRGIDSAGIFYSLKNGDLTQGDLLDILHEELESRPVETEELPKAA